MKKTQTIVEIICDGCGGKLLVHHPAFDRLPAQTGPIHYCKSCCRDLEIYAARVIRNEVPSRRGGTRTLGEYDG